MSIPLKGWCALIGNKIKPFYAEGLEFKCNRCSVCCRHTPGYVFLSLNDLHRLLSHTQMEKEKFLQTYCRIIPTFRGKKISLQEKRNYDCIFWNNGGCIYYEARPFQCRSFPFWTSHLSSKSKWQELTSFCPGIGKGIMHHRIVIEEWIKEGKGENYFYL